MKRTRVKMCGMTRTQDIDHAIQLGVDALGFIFYEQSARHITIEQANRLLNNIPPFIELVAVCVNSESAFVKRLISELPIHTLQFHGDEDVAFCNQFNKPYIKAIHPHTSVQIDSAMDDFNQAKAILLDTPSSHRGGSGTTFDWNIIPKKMPKPCIVAGGLNEFNIGEVIQIASPFAVDVCSGIEAEPGIKDHVKMTRFMTALWNGDNE